MSDALNTALFGIYPYIALTVLVIGSLVRFDREQFTWRSGSSQLLRRRQLIWGSNLFHIGILVIFAGHLVGLLTPISVFDAVGIGHGTKQLMAIVIGGIAGLACLAGLLMLLHRRLFDPRIRKTSSTSDILVLWLLLAQLVLGLLTITVSLGHLDGSEMVALMSWAQGVLSFEPDAARHVLGAHPLFKLHLALGLTILLVFPFTRLVHMLSAPVWYLGRRGYQVVRTLRPAGR